MLEFHDSFAGCPPHPLTQVDNYPGLRSAALRTQVLPSLEQGLLISGPVPGIPGEP